MSVKFGTLPERAFISMREDLNQCPTWDKIDISAVSDAPSPVALSTLPFRAVLKVRLQWVISALLGTLGLTDAATILAADATFDTALRRLYHALSLALTDSDPATQQAAARALPLLLPDGLAPARLRFDQEVDWGRQAAARAETLSPEDTKRLNLPPFLSDLSRATEALALTIGLTPGKSRNTAKSRRIREALADCQQTFKGSYQDLRWLYKHTTSPTERADLSSILAIFDTILRRYDIEPPTLP